MADEKEDKPGFAKRTLAFVADPGVSTWRKLIGAVAAAYVIMPFDLIPDFLPLIGWLDDLGVVGAVSWYMVLQINRHAETKAAKGQALG